MILKWYKDAHAPKGWTVFMDQMKKFVEWLEQAESGERASGFPVWISCLEFFDCVGSSGVLEWEVGSLQGLRRQGGAVCEGVLGTVCGAGRPHPWLQVLQQPRPRPRRPGSPGAQTSPWGGARAGARRPGGRCRAC